MAHPTTSEASTPVSAEAVQDFIADQFLGGADDPAPEEEEQDPEADEVEGDEVEGDEPEASDETQEETDEAREPIDPPISWDKDAKELFAQLPRELQETVATREAQRDKAIQAATTEAANAKRTASVEANQALAETQRQYASHLEQIASHYAPQPPDPALAAQDPGRYIALKAQFDHDIAQHNAVVQQAMTASREAEQREALVRQEEIAFNSQVLAGHFGEEWTNPSSRQALLTDLESVGAELGYPMELMSQASATDILALAKVRDLKVKADKYDALQKNKMAAVRAAKDAPRVAKPGTAPTRGEQTSRSREAAWQRAKQTRSGDDYAAVLESMGVKL